jgi:hypothetical protein
MFPLVRPVERLQRGYLFYFTSEEPLTKGPFCRRFPLNDKTGYV